MLLVVALCGAAVADVKEHERQKRLWPTRCYPGSHCYPEQEDVAHLQVTRPDRLWIRRSRDIQSSKSLIGRGFRMIGRYVKISIVLKNFSPFLRVIFFSYIIQT